MKRKWYTGFTVVEIIVVIVIIGILAAAVAIVYRGVSADARASKTLAHVDQWEKIIRTYQTKDRLLPEDWTCLGETADEFPAIPSKSIGKGQCERNMILENPTPSWTSEYKTVPTPGQSKPTADLLRDSATVFEGKLRMVESGSDKYMRGIVYASIAEPHRAPNSKPGAFIFFALENRQCPASAEQRKVDDSIFMCALRLTSDNYMNEIFRHYP